MSSSERQVLLWMFANYSSVLQQVLSNAGSFTQVSPYVGQVQQDGSPGNLSLPIEVAQVHAKGLGVIGLYQNNQSDSTGLNALFSDVNKESSMISALVDFAVANLLDGVCIDFEPAANCNQLASEFAAWLSSLAEALHAHGKILCVAVGGWGGSQVLWNWYLLGRCQADYIITMGTYGASMETFSEELLILTAAVAAGKQGAGLITNTDDSTIQQRIAQISLGNVPMIGIWPYGGQLVPTSYLPLLQNYLAGGGRSA